MPYHDLNLPYPPGASPAAVSHTLTFAAELGYTIIALATSVTGKLPMPPPAVNLTTLTVPPGVKLLTRLTLTVSDPSQNHRLASLHPLYNILALRPTTEKALQLCCQTLSCDIISLDLSVRLPFILKFKTVASAIRRGIRFEICYSPGILGGSDAKRNLISGAAALIRATRGRGIIVSSEARNVLGLRGPHDMVNLVSLWGLSQERGKEAVGEEADKVVRLARLQRESYRGVVEVVDDGRLEEAAQATVADPSVGTRMSSKEGDGARPNVMDLKRKASETSLNTPIPASDEPAAAAPQLTPSSAQPLSKREQKRRAKKARFEANRTHKPQKTQAQANTTEVHDAGDSSFPIRHEALSVPSKAPSGHQQVNKSTKKKS